MSKWFATAWDQKHIGLLDWYDFSHGWCLSTYGGEKEVLSFLFRAIDKDADSYIQCKDAIEYCLSALTNVDRISKKNVANTITSIFEDLNRNGPFDVITEEEFIDYAQKNPESVFGTWGKILQWKNPSQGRRTPTTSPPASPLKKRSSSRKLMQRAKTDGAHGTISKADSMREVKAANSDRFDFKANAHGRSMIGLISPSKERTLTAKSSPATERVEETPIRRKKGGKTHLSPYSQNDYWNIPEHRILSFGDGNVIDLDDEHEETLKPW